MAALDSPIGVSRLATGLTCAAMLSCSLLHFALASGRWARVLRWWRAAWCLLAATAPLRVGLGGL